MRYLVFFSVVSMSVWSTVALGKTIEDLVASTISRTHTHCQIAGRITDETIQADSIGIYSNDFRVVLYRAIIHADGNFQVSDVLPGTYRVIPLFKPNNRQTFTPPMGYVITCSDKQSFHQITFSSEGTDAPSASQKQVDSNDSIPLRSIKTREPIDHAQTKWPNRRHRE